MKKEHKYTLSLNWLGDPFNNSVSNDRKYKVSIEGKPSFIGSADQSFFGDNTFYNPEDLLLASLSSCHMMSYFYICRKNGINISSYVDQPEGFLKVNKDGSGQFEKVILKPRIEIIEGDKENAEKLHVTAGKLCFIANSCVFKIEYSPQIIIVSK